MIPKYLADHQYSNVQTTKVTATAPPSSSTPSTASIFNNAQNTYISGGSFSVTTQTTNLSTTSGSSPLDALYKRAAPNAILNAGGRVDEVRCDPDTRKEFLGRIVKWRDAQDSRTPPISWLSGPAGAGKTAIMQTIAERCIKEGIPQANFFFFRADTSRNSVSPLVATLVHQILLLYPSLRDPVAVVLSDNPLIFDCVLENQLTQLIAMPLHNLQQTSPSTYVAPLFVIDGLDECISEEKRDQRKILLAFNKVLTAYPHLFRLLVASRDELQIQKTFNEITDQLLSLDLNDQDSPDNDIRIFVNNELKLLRKTHPLACSLDANWPSFEDVDDIVRKSSGQFIYAATVMRFLMESPASPTLSLARVQGAAAQLSTLTSPFSYLDALYTYILSRANDREIFKDILPAQLFLDQYLNGSEFVWVTERPSLLWFLQVYNPKYTEAIVQSYLVDLTPLTTYGLNNGVDELLFHHASFSDYLLDHSRSGDYFINLDAFNVEITPAVWTSPELSESNDLKRMAYFGLRRLSRLPPGFLKILAALDPLLLGRIFLCDSQFEVAGMFNHIFMLCTCQDDVSDYKQILRQWIYMRNFDSMFMLRLLGIQNSRWPPCSNRYFAMAYVDRHPTVDPLMDHVGVSMCPETPSDAHETAVWLKDLLHRIHREKHSIGTQKYEQVVRNWMSWAAANDISLVGVDDIPCARAYLRRKRIKKWVENYLKIGSFV